MFWTGLILGLFLGVAVGIFTAGLCTAAGRTLRRHGEEEAARYAA